MRLVVILFLYGSYCTSHLDARQKKDKYTLLEEQKHQIDNSKENYLSGHDKNNKDVTFEHELSEHIKVKKKSLKKKKRSRKKSRKKTHKVSKSKRKGKKRNTNARLDADLELKRVYEAVVDPSERSKLRALSSQLPSRSGDSIIDEIVTAAFMKLEQKDESGAERIFKQLLEIRDDVQAVWTGLGTLYMNSGRNDEALEVANQMIRINPKNSEGYRLRADISRSKAMYDAALTDLSKAVQLSPQDSQLRDARGVMAMQMGALSLAREDFLTLLSLQQSQLQMQMVYYYLGDVCMHMGHLGEAVEHVDRGLRTYNSYLPLWILRISILKSAARWREALDTSDTIISADGTSNNIDLLRLRGEIERSIGRPARALQYFTRAISRSNVNTMDQSSMTQAALCLQSLGRMSETLDMQTKVIKKDPENKAWYSREVSAYISIHLLDDFKSFNIDREIHPMVRSGYLNEQQTFADVIASRYVSLVDQARAKLKTSLLGVKQQPPLVASKEALHLLSLTSHMGKWVQLDCEGFVPSVRQHRQFGLAVLEMAQTIRRHVALLQKGEMGLQVSDSTSSRKSSAWSAASKTGCKTGHHRLGYRDLMDIAVRWRQLSEPNDAVFWFEFLPKDVQGYMLSTALLQGDMIVPRYAPNIPTALRFLSGAIKEKFFVGDDVFEKRPQKLNDSQVLLLSDVDGVEALFDVVGKGFWTFVEVRGLAQSVGKLQGTRVVLTEAHGGYGLSLSIRTPSSLERLESFELELEAAFDRLLKCLLNNNNNSENDGNDNDLELTCTQRHSLELFYYWAHLSPLTRGTAATGYAVLLASILAGGHVIGKKMPKQRQLDWEAIFTPEPSDFLRHGQSWVDGLIPAPFSEEVLDGAVGYSVADIINTPAKTLAVLAKLTGKDEEEEYPFVQNGQILHTNHVAGDRSEL